MDRRHFIGATVGVLSGCMGLRQPVSGVDPTPSGTPTVSTEPADGVDIASLGVPSTICSGEIHENRIPAVVDPVFEDSWEGIDIQQRYLSMDYRQTKPVRTGLPDHRKVIGIARGDVARAYPLGILFWHEIVNDSIDLPVLITYCPNCASGLVARREVNGEPTIFGVTGQLWRPPDGLGVAAIESGRGFAAAEINDTASLSVADGANLVMFDTATGSFWSQMLATAICGPETGTELTLLPASFTSWGEWRGAHPDTSVLLPPPHSDTISSYDPDGPTDNG